MTLQLDLNNLFQLEKLVLNFKVSDVCHLAIRALLSLSFSCRYFGSIVTCTWSCGPLQGPRPSAMVIERTMDGGRTWQPAIYMATDCPKSYPGILTSVPLTLDQTYCYTLPPTGANPYQDHMVRIKPITDSIIVSPEGNF